MIARPVTTEQMPPLFMAVGELIINWSLLDSQIVKIVAAIYHSTDGKHGESRMPFEFGRRVKFLRRCVSRIPALASFADEMNALLMTARELTTIRDALIHGSLSSYNERDQTFAFVKLDIDHADQMHAANVVKMTLADLGEAIVSSQRAMTSAIALSERLFEAIV